MTSIREKENLVEVRLQNKYLYIISSLLEKKIAVGEGS